MQHGILASLRTRLLAVVLVALIPPLALTLYDGISHERSAAAEAQVRAQDTVHAAALRYEALIQGTLRRLADLARLPALQGAGPECAPTLKAVLTGIPYGTELNLVDDGGRVVCSSMPLTMPVSVADGEYFRRVLEARGPVVGDYLVSPVSGRSAVVLAYPVDSPAGQVRAVLTAGLDLGWVKEITAAVPLPPGTTLMVLDTRGTVVARHPDPEGLVGQTLPASPWLRGILEQEAGTAEGRGPDGAPYLYAFQVLRPEGALGALHVVVGIPAAVAYAGARRSLLLNLAALALTAFLSLAGTWLASTRFIFRHVDRLLETTRRVRAGDLSARTGLPHDAGELSRLARAVDEMAGALAARVGEIQHQEQRFRRLADNAPDVIFRFRIQPTPGLEYVSQAVTALTGYTPEEVYADPGLFLKVVHPDDQPLAAAFCQGCHPAEAPDTVRVVRKDGRVISIQFNAVPVRDEAGNLLAWEGIARDVTDLRAAQEALARANAALEQQVAAHSAELTRLAAILNHTPDWVGMFDPAGRTLYVNRGGRQALGIPEAEDLTGAPFSAFFAPQAQEQLLETAIPTALREGIWRGEATLLRRDGSEFPVSQVILAHRSAGDGEVLLSTIMRDITDLKRAEQATLDALEEAARANRAKSEFISRMSHELRTPLNAVLGFAQILQMGGLAPEQAEAVDLIIKGGRHLLDLINEILDISRIDVGSLSLSPEPVQVGEVVAEVLDLAGALAEQAGIRLEVEGARRCTRHVLADRQRLKQVLLNLVQNAIKYNRPTGRVDVSYIVTPSGWLRILVHDTGPGIPADKLDRLFTPFDRLGAEQSGVEGTGLGLALSKRLTTAMGGNLGVQSREGAGSSG